MLRKHVLLLFLKIVKIKVYPDDTLVVDVYIYNHFQGLEYLLVASIDVPLC